MALKLAGEETGVQENIETIQYLPGLQASGNLEAGTKTVTAISKQGTADYTANLTTSAPPDSRLQVKRLCQRLNIHIDSFGGSPAATKLYYLVEVNGVERASGEFTGAGADNPVSWELTEGQFNLGSANTVSVFLWVDQGSAVVSVCELWQAVGTAGTGYEIIAELQFRGLVTVVAELGGVGTGTPQLRVCPWDVPAFYAYPYLIKVSGSNAIATDTFISKEGAKFVYQTSVSSDIVYSRTILLYLRSL